MKTLKLTTMLLCLLCSSSMSLAQTQDKEQPKETNAVTSIIPVGKGKLVNAISVVEEDPITIINGNDFAVLSGLTANLNINKQSAVLIMAVAACAIDRPDKDIFSITIAVFIDGKMINKIFASSFAGTTPIPINCLTTLQPGSHTIEIRCRGTARVTDRSLSIMSFN